MKTFLKIAVVIGAVVGLIALKVWANDMDQVRVNSWIGGTNITVVASNSTSSAVIGPPITNGSFRVAIQVNNLGTIQGVGLKFYSNYGTLTTPDVIVGPLQTKVFYFGEGWNTMISARSTNASTPSITYNEQYR
jgi:hypothetical protein